MKKYTINKIIDANRNFSRKMDRLDKISDIEIFGVKILPHSISSIIYDHIFHRYSKYFRGINKIKDITVLNELYVCIRDNVEKGENISWHNFSCCINGRLCNLKGRIVTFSKRDRGPILYDIEAKPTGFDFDGDVVPFMNLKFSCFMDRSKNYAFTRRKIDTTPDPNFPYLIVDPVEDRKIPYKDIFNQIFYDWMWWNLISRDTFR